VKNPRHSREKQHPMVFQPQENLKSNGKSQKEQFAACWKIPENQVFFSCVAFEKNL
jgi:hypothetical protein